MLMPYLHLPVQSGSDRVLAAMNRQHRARDYLRLVERLRAARPDLALSSDFIVGFPGETDAISRPRSRWCAKWAMRRPFRSNTAPVRARRPRRRSAGSGSGRKLRGWPELQACCAAQQDALQRRLRRPHHAGAVREARPQGGTGRGPQPLSAARARRGCVPLIGTIRDVRIDAVLPNSLKGACLRIAVQLREMAVALSPKERPGAARRGDARADDARICRQCRARRLERLASAQSRPDRTETGRARRHARQSVVSIEGDAQGRATRRRPSCARSMRASRRASRSGLPRSTRKSALRSHEPKNLAGRRFRRRPRSDGAGRVARVALARARRLSRSHADPSTGVRHRPCRYRQDLSRGGVRRPSALRAPGRAADPVAAGARSGRASGLSSRRPQGKDRSLSAPAL